MAKVHKLTDNSWAIFWTLKIGLPMVLCTDHFEIPGYQTTFSLHFYSDLCVSLVDVVIKERGIEIPENIFVIWSGAVSKLSEVKSGAWSIDIINSEEFINCMRRNEITEIDLIFILHFPTTGENHIIQHMSKLLQTGQMSDVSFIVQGEKIEAHKNIVVSASPVMSAMFAGENFKEGRFNTVEVNDMDSKVFRQLLHYIYTGAAPELKEETMAESLFLAADKYQVEGLKCACVNSLISKLNLENAIHFLVVGYLHSAPKLQEASCQCLKKHKSAVWERPEWQELMKSYQDLFYQTCKRMFSSPPTKQ